MTGRTSARRQPPAPGPAGEPAASLGPPERIIRRATPAIQANVKAITVGFLAETRIDVTNTIAVLKTQTARLASPGDR